MKQSIKLTLSAILISGLFLAGCSTAQPKQEASEDGITFSESEFDFGIIKQSGGIVSHNFSFTYAGDSSVAITGVVGSCACTEGKVDTDKLEKGDRGILTVEFDPNLHEEPIGRFYKTVSILTEPKLSVMPEVKIWAEIDLDLGQEAYKLQGPHEDDDDHHDDEEAHDSGQQFHILKPIQLKQMLEDKDFFLLDVHIPEQTHIPGTDAFIDYRKLTENLDKLPQNKNAKLVVYCRSGSMSRAAATELIELGYTNVYDLEGGINAFNSL
jgi:rhodanese-related sulfurtransferase